MILRRLSVFVLLAFAATLATTAAQQRRGTPDNPVPVNCTPNHMPIGVSPGALGTWKCVNLTDPPEGKDIPLDDASIQKMTSAPGAKSTISTLQATMQIINIGLQAWAQARAAAREAEAKSTETLFLSLTDQHHDDLLADMKQPKPIELHPFPKVIARIESVSGPVFIRQGSTAEQRVRAGFELAEGDVVITKGKGTATITFEDGSKARLEQVGVFTGGSTELAVRSATHLELLTGKLEWIGAAIHPELRVKTPFFTDGVRDTQFTATVDANGGTTTVQSGTVVMFDYAGRSDTLTAGMSRRVPLDAIVPLPPSNPVYRMMNGLSDPNAAMAFLPLQPAGLWVNPKLWDPKWVDLDIASRLITSRDGKLVGTLSIDPVPRTSDEVVAEALGDAKRQDPGATIRERQNLTLGVVSVTRVLISMTQMGHRYAFLGHYFSGAQGVVRAIVTARAEDAAAQSDAALELLNGLVVLHPNALSLPGPAWEQALAAERDGDVSRAFDLYLVEFNRLRALPDATFFDKFFGVAEGHQRDVLIRIVTLASRVNRPLPKSALEAAARARNEVTADRHSFGLAGARVVLDRSMWQAPWDIDGLYNLALMNEHLSAIVTRPNALQAVAANLFEIYASARPAELPEIRSRIKALRP